LKKPPLREDDHSSPTRAEIKYVWSYTSLPLECFHGVYRDNFTPMLFTQFYAVERGIWQVWGRSAYRALEEKLKGKRPH
jgi:hypothetical protein